MNFPSTMTDLRIRHTWSYMRDPDEYWSAGMRSAGLIPLASRAAMAALAKIAEYIAMTNNGKLMIERCPSGTRDYIGELVRAGKLERDGFLRSGDAIRLPGTREHWLR